MWKCRHCGEDVEDSSDSAICWNCGYSRDGIPPENPEAFSAAKEDAAQPDEPEQNLDLRGSISMAQEAWARSVVGEVANQGSDPRERYPAVPAISGALRVLAWIVGLSTGAVAVVVLLATPPYQEWTSTLLTMLWLMTGGAILVALLLAASEGLRILRDTEENTRHAAMSQYGRDQE